MNVNVTRIDRLSNGMVQFYNGSDVVDSFSITSSVSVGFENNLAKTIVFSNSVKTLSFNVFNLTTLYGATSSKIYSSGIDPSDTSTAYISRLYDIYGFLISDVVQGCCPGPTFVGGVVASYPNYASFPATGQHSVIYIDEGTNQAYFWDGTSYQLLVSTGVEQYASFALFPVTGSANVIYIDMSVPEPYVWDGAAYVSLIGTATVTWGSITGTLSAQTDLQTALNAKFDIPTGTTLEYLDGTGTPTLFPTLPTGTVTSVGLTMPSAFSVANSPVTTSGTLAVTGAGTVSQYVRGDGSLANFPSSTGGGSSLAFYLNGSVAQGTIGGIAFKEMDRTPIFGAGTDFTINANGYIQSFITDANVPNQLEIPAGNWNFETYFSASSSGGTPSFYVELYKWNGTTLSLIASNSATPEGITNGTAIDAYFSALAVPQTTLAATDRLAIRIYVTHSGRTITLHTENSHLCEVITTFSTGLTALNGLTAQVQNFATGTSGTDFAISSATSTHTFNLPTASAANRGALSSADWTTFNGKFTLPALTSGSVLFSNGTTIAQDNANLFWDDTNNRLGIGTTTPSVALTIFGTNELLQIGDGSAANSSYISFNGTRSQIGYKSNGLHLLTSTGRSLVFGSGTFASTTAWGVFFGTTGNLGINTITDAGFKLDVNGSTRANSIFFGAGLPSVLSVDPTTALTNITIAGTSVRIGDNVGSTISGYQTYVTSPGIADRQYTSGEGGVMMLGSTLGFSRTFSPTSGTGVFNILRLSSTINQTGGANGITRGLYINPTLTASADFRAIETTAGKVIFAGTGNVLIGTTTDAGFKLDVSGTARVSGALRADSSLLVNGTSINGSAIAQFDSGTRGFLPPRMTTTQKNAIATPAAGLVVYDTTLGKLCVRGAAAWETITSL